MIVLTCSLDDNGHNQTVNSEDTSHDHGDDVSHHKLGVHDTHGRNSNTRLGSTVSSTDIYRNRKKTRK